jgi:hypothetical protein
MFWKPLLTAFFVAALSAPAFAQAAHFDLHCTPLPIAHQKADRDPVAQIHVQLDVQDDHFDISVMHETVSGRKFWRADQYRDIGLRHVGPVERARQDGVMSDQWAWYGTSIKNSNVVMVGKITQIDDVFAYWERVINIHTKAEELIVNAQCTAAG